MSLRILLVDDHIVVRQGVRQLLLDRGIARQHAAMHFEIARRDLELRGPGELLGTRQTGLAQLRVADLLRDADLLPRVQQSAERLLARHPTEVAALTARWIGAAGERYGRIG